MPDKWSRPERVKEEKERIRKMFNRDDATIQGEPVRLRDLFLPAAFSKRRLELPDYQPNSRDVLAATVKPFIYFASDGGAYWCEGGTLEMRNLRFDVDPDIDPSKIRIRATVETKLDLIGEATEPWIRGEKTKEKP